MGRVGWVEEVASGERRVTSWRKKQVPQASRPGWDRFRPELQRRSDNLQGWRRAGRVAELIAVVALPVSGWEQAPI